MHSTVRAPNGKRGEMQGTSQKVIVGTPDEFNIYEQRNIGGRKQKQPSTILPRVIFPFWGQAKLVDLALKFVLFRVPARGRVMQRVTAVVEGWVRLSQNHSFYRKDRFLLTEKSDYTARIGVFDFHQKVGS